MHRMTALAALQMLERLIPGTYSHAEKLAFAQAFEKRYTDDLGEAEDQGRRGALHEAEVAMRTHSGWKLEVQRAAAAQNPLLIEMEIGTVVGRIADEMQGRGERISRLYYEAHITIEPVFDAARDRAAEIAKASGFKLAHLLMQKRKDDTAERSKHDTFMTGHGKAYHDLCGRLVICVHSLHAAGFKVWRYKIEDTLIDSRTQDVLGLHVEEPTNEQ